MKLPALLLCNRFCAGRQSCLFIGLTCSSQIAMVLGCHDRVMCHGILEDELYQITRICQFSTVKAVSLWMNSIKSQECVDINV